MRVATDMNHALALPLGQIRARDDGARLLGLATTLWIVLAVAASVKMVVAPLSHSNYLNFEYGARQWWADRSMYDVGPRMIEYRYGPAFAVALTPLALLPTALGGVPWIWLNVGAMYAAARALARHVLPGRWTPFRQGLFLLMVLIGTVRMVWAAQVNPLVFAMVALAAVAIVRERWWTASALLAFAIHVKVWPLAAALLLSACYPRKLPLRLAVAWLVIAAVPLVTRPWPIVFWQYHQWYEAIFGRMAVVRHAYRDAWTLFETLGWTAGLRAYTVQQVLAGAAAAGLCLWQSRVAPPGRLLTFILAMWLAWQMIYGPATERNTFGMIVPLTAWATITAVQQRRAAAWMQVAFALTTILSAGAVERAVAPWFPLALAAHPVGVLMFAAWMVYHARSWNLSEPRLPLIVPRRLPQAA